MNLRLVCKGLVLCVPESLRPLFPKSLLTNQFRIMSFKLRAKNRKLHSFIIARENLRLSFCWSELTQRQLEWEMLLRWEPSGQISSLVFEVLIFAGESSTILASCLIYDKSKRAAKSCFMQKFVLYRSWKDSEPKWLFFMR